MKIKSLIAAIGFVSVHTLAYAQTVVITDDSGYTIGEASSVLDVKSTTKGLLIPRLTQAERNLISLPAGGLMIYQTDNSPGFYYYNGSAWTSVSGTTDGSETKVNSGASVNVTGQGTLASPYTPSFRTQSVTRAERLAIVTPLTGQIVWCSDCGTTGEMQIYNGTSWTTWCGGTPAPVLPTVTTTAVSSITGTTAASGGNVTSDGGGTVNARGVCWNTSVNPTIANSKTTDGSGNGSFTSSITGLSFGTTYYARAYATNSSGTSYGNEITFTTLNVPTLTTTAISSITGTSASSGGNITADGGASVTARGVCWSTSPNPTTANNTTSNGAGTGSYSSSITGLSNGTTYYVRAYATNAAGTAYGNQVSFATLALPSLTTTAAYSITATSATSGGTVSSDGGATVTTRGVCWNTTGSPTTSNSYSSSGSGTGSYAITISGLTQGTTYYVRSYATNSLGTAYGDQISFTTTTIPTLTTTAASSITTTTASSGGTISSDGGASVTARGVCWSTSSNPTTANSKTADGTGTGSFSSSITGLSPGTLYYVRAYATNSAGTAYGNQVTFTTTSASLPTVTTTAVTATTGLAATSGGNVTSDGGSSVTARGVCWSTSPNPTTANSKTTNGIGTGIFTSSITGLTRYSTYYVRAYATNSAGTAYGSQVSFISMGIGDSYLGGVVAYILASGDPGYDATTMHGLIAAASDEGTAVWGCDGTDIPGANGSAIGTGWQNTYDIVNGCTDNGIAARLCWDSYSGGWDDWYLPSIDELTKLYNNKDLIGGFQNNIYWSSSEYNYANAWLLDFTTGAPNRGGTKGSTRYVRAIKAF